MIQINLDQKICSQCKGLCCQGHPGAWVDPVRFFHVFFLGQTPDPEFLRKQLKERSLEMRDFDGVQVPAPLSGNVGCVFRTPTGCRFPSAQRPCQCLALEPSIETLIHGEIRCRLPEGYSFGPTRKRWMEFWAGHPGQRGTMGSL